MPRYASTPAPKIDSSSSSSSSLLPSLEHTLKKMMYHSSHLATAVRGEQSFEA